MPLQFEWDARKAKGNKAKHGVSFEEATTVFADALARIFGDEAHSEAERREIIIGHSERPNLIGLISARKATRTERKDYEENVSS